MLDTLKKFFPFAFTVKADMSALIISVLIQLVAGLVVGWVISIFTLIPLIGLVIGLVGALLDLYIVASVVITFLDYFGALK